MIYRHSDTLLRVSVMVAGERRQRYFRHAGTRRDRRHVERLAARLERRWLGDQRRAAQNRQHQARPTSRAHYPHRTGVRGILLQLAVTRRGRKRWAHLRFEVTAGRAGARPFATSVAIKGRGLAAAWKDAVRLLAEHRGIRDYSHWLRRRPKPAQLRAMRRK